MLNPERIVPEWREIYDAILAEKGSLSHQDETELCGHRLKTDPLSPAER
jgi:hypothetical protein